MLTPNAGTNAIMRLIIDPPLSGPENMARDETLLERVRQGSSAATLRLYRWSPPTISLGYFQKFDEYDRLPAPAGVLGVVRRTTGGGAILHDSEWTYSLVAPAGDPLLEGPAISLYERVHDAIIDTLQLLGVTATRCGISDDSTPKRGPFFCFARRHCTDVIMPNGAKLAGSAQRRLKEAVLQHGSIIVAARNPQQPAAAIRDHVDVSAEDVLRPLIDALANRLEVVFEEDEWTSEELEMVEALVAKHEGDEWLTKY